MNPLQKIYELFSKLGDLKIMLVPVMFILAGIAGVWYKASEYIPGWAVGLIIILILVGGAAYCYIKYIRPWWLKRKAAAAPGEEAAEEEVPEISDEEFKLALKEKFARGVADLAGFRKDADKLPLYLVVGEKGCGKSEAIRRSGIGFPAGLTNTEQGVGGTEILDWWITNRSVLLDL
ncbi:MAG: hypothetical protein L3K26_19550, partial [Candidatus Hydrogenedentes bacterium]|nr:hypothetical protein [Candidatus Hydrogenedentota bacterium]